MSMNRTPCAGILLVALFGLSGPARADSIHENAGPGGFGAASANFEVPAEVSQPQESRTRNAGRFCCLGASAGSPLIDEFYWVADQEADQGKNPFARVAATSALGFEGSGIRGPAKSTGGEAGQQDAYFANNEEAAAVNFALGADGAPFYAVPWGGAAGALALGFSAPTQGGGNDSSSIVDPALHGNDGGGKTFRTGPIGVKRGPGGPPVLVNAPVSVSEPPLLGLLGAGLGIVGLLILKRATDDSTNYRF